MGSVIDIPSDVSARIKKVMKSQYAAFNRDKDIERQP